MNTAESAAIDEQFDIEKIQTLPKFEAADYLRSQEALAAFINEFLAEADSAMLAEVMLVAAKAKGMTEVASKAGIARESLYKALRPESQPRFDTILKVLNAIGLKLVVQPICDASSDQTGCTNTSA